MRKGLFIQTFFCCLLGMPAALPAQEKTGLDAEFTRLEISTALVVPSQAVDEYPMWSPDGSHLAMNIMGTWYQLDLAQVKLREAKWLGMKIGAPESLPDPVKISAEDVSVWKQSSKRGNRKIELRSGKVVGLLQTELSTQFVVREANGEEKVLWKTDIEDRYEMTAAKDEKFVAFICATNGVFITRSP